MSNLAKYLVVFLLPIRAFIALICGSGSVVYCTVIVVSVIYSSSPFPWWREGR